MPSYISEIHQIIDMQYQGVTAIDAVPGLKPLLLYSIIYIVTLFEITAAGSVN